MPRDYYDVVPPDPDEVPEDGVEDDEPEPMFDTLEEKDGKK